MLGYYLQLALRTLRRNIVLTSLIIASVGVGIGAYMTMLTVLLAMSGDPIPQKSEQLFVPQIDVWGRSTGPRCSGRYHVAPAVHYRDAVAFMQAHAAKRQVAMYALQLDVTPAAGPPRSRSREGPLMAISLRCSRRLSRRSRLGRKGRYRSCRRGGAGRNSCGSPVSTPVRSRSGGESGRPTVSGDRGAGALESAAAVLRCQRQCVFASGAVLHSLYHGHQPRDAKCRQQQLCVDTAAGWSGHLAGECIWIQYWAEAAGRHGSAGLSAIPDQLLR